MSLASKWVAEQSVVNLNPLKVLYNILDEYTYGPICHKDVHAKTQMEKETTITSPNGECNNINSNGEISLVAVKKYLKAWVTYL